MLLMLGEHMRPQVQLIELRTWRGQSSPMATRAPLHEEPPQATPYEVEYGGLVFELKGEDLESGAQRILHTCYRP